jgi:DNA polymerase elongation subunit (family B)
MKIQYAPTLFLPTKKPTEWHGLHGESLEPKKFETIRDARDFIKRYSEVEKFKIYGNSNFEYAFIADTQKEMINWQMNDINIAIIDIEVGSENGFPDPKNASEPITAIAIRRLNGKTRVYGCGEYVNKDEDAVYVKCDDEYSLCKQFLKDWQENYPDVISGWNVQLFDIPYLYNRLMKILGEDLTKKLSPWDYIHTKEKLIKGKTHTVFSITGIAVLDYIDLYRWYAPNGKSQESYKLDSIANVELGESKLSYDDYDNLFRLLSTKSRDIKVNENKPIEDMEEFEKWCFLRDKIKKELGRR